MFSNGQVQELARVISATGGLSCLITFWDAEGTLLVTREGNACFIKEYSLLLLSIYQYLLWKLDKKPETRVALFGVFSLYMKLKKVPLVELFTALESCLAIYKEILEEYNFPFNNPSLWSGWLWTHWYIPTAAVLGAFWAWRQWKGKKNKRSAEGRLESRTSIFVRYQISGSER